MQVDLYNASVCQWEPFVEECHFRLNAEIKGGEQPSTEATLSLPQPCNFNLSPSMSTLLSSTLLTLADDVAGKHALRLAGSAEAPFAPYSISNRTGVPFRYGRARAGRPEAVVVPGHVEPFDFWPEATRQELCARALHASLLPTLPVDASKRLPSALRSPSERPLEPPSERH